MSKKKETVNGLKRQLVAALSMMLVSTVALGSSTYAWFTMNTKVTASQVQVTAASADPFLQIKNTNEADTNYTTTLTLANTGDTTQGMPLAAPKNIEGGLTYTNSVLATSWYTSISDDVDKAVTAISATKAKDLIAMKSADVVNGFAENTAAIDEEAKAGRTCVVVNDITLRNSAKANANNLRVKMNATNSANTVNKVEDSFRVLLVSDKGDIIVFDKSGDVVVRGSNNENYESQYAPASLTKEADGYVKLKNATTIAEDQTVAVRVFVFFDGTDKAAMSANEFAQGNFAASLEFIVDSTQA